MPPETTDGVRGVLVRNRGLIFPVLIVTSVLVIVTPLPPTVMDLLLACNVTVAVLILLTSIHVSRPLEFSVFPAILLGTTLARLVLNVASTRLILTRGATDGTRAAGGVIEAFGKFVAGGEGEIVVGLIIFTILIIVQFLVITKGTTRISEVAARFALDGMPGKQLAIDADLSAGVVTAGQAKARRQEITEQADFYAAMDGAGKFVRGDAVASIAITLVNIAGGFYVGMVKHGMEFQQAVEVFTTLTIGDGLVTQVPAFLISLSAGLIVTRTSSDSNLPGDVVTQLFRHPQTLFLAGGFLASLSFTGLPTAPLLTLGICCAFLGLTLRGNQAAGQATDRQRAANDSPGKSGWKPEHRLSVDPLELELGVRLIRLADADSGGDLLRRLTRAREKIAQELGMILPKVRIRDNIRLGAREYRIKIRGVPVAGGEAFPEAVLAVAPVATTVPAVPAPGSPAAGDLPGLETIEPESGRPGRWIEAREQNQAERMGYRIVKPAAVLINHLTEVVREHSGDLLTRQHVHQLLDNLKQTSPNLLDDLIPEQLKTAHVHQVLNNLLRERVPIRDLETILETLSHFADRTKDTAILTEYVRSSLARTICQQYRDANRVLHVVTLDPVVEEILSAGFDYGDRGLIAKLSPQVSEAVVQAIGREIKKLVTARRPAVVWCAPQVRAGLKQITSASLPKLAVLSIDEITRDTQVELAGEVGVEVLEEVAAAAA